ncbi:MAG: TIGR02302 family protein [Methylovirgula sp.]
MSENNNREQKGGRPVSGAADSRRLDRVVRLARAALFWERLWRALMPPLLVIGFFIALSFAGLWLEVTRPWRIGGVVLFAIALAASLLPFLRLGRPSRREALSRIDRESGLPHSPASGLDDALANAGGDPATLALWALHRQRLTRNIAALRAGLPSPRMVDFDRYALRAGVLVALFASAFVAGPEKYARVASAFDWRDNSIQSGGYRVDAWIDPPLYTGRPPVLLKLGTAEATDRQHPEKISAPIGSTVIVRASGGDLRLETKGGLEAPKAAPKTTAKNAVPAPGSKPEAPAAVAPPPAAAANSVPDDHEHRLALRGDAQLDIRRSGDLLGIFAIAVIPDKPPQIALTDAPRTNLRGTLTLSYKITDDYGAASAQANFADPSIEGAKGQLRSLVPPPQAILALPSGPGGLGETQTTIDLSDHPWAGARVKMTLTARDEGGNEGESVPIEITLPQKNFTKPLALALAEQRRDLVLFPDEKDQVETALDALMIAPRVFSTSASVYLGLSVAENMLRHAKNDADILAAADLLWSMALQIENGDLSGAERDLRAAEKKLREALQHNASDAEIRKLTENLRKAMDNFLKEFAQQQRQRNPQDPAAQAPNSQNAISRKDLQAMLDRMQEMARAGDRANAQKMLDQLQNTLDNLAMARRQQADPAQREMSKALNQLDKMMRDQQKLRDETHRQGMNQQGQQGQQGQDQMGQGPMGRDQMDQGQMGQDQMGQDQQDQQGMSGQQPGSESQNGNGDLSQRQQALRNQLEQLQKRLQQTGQGEKGLDEAGRAMQQAEKALQQGSRQGNSAAVGAQGRALEALRRGAEQLAQRMQAEGKGNGQGSQGSPQAEQEGGTDPLGRPMGGDPAFNPYSRYDPMGIPAAERAQRVLEELRKRLSDPARPHEEMDYLERLLRRY